MPFKLSTNSESIANIDVDSSDCDSFSTLLESKSFKDELQDLPVILDIKGDDLQANELAVMLEILVQNQVVVIGIRSNKQELIDFANFSGLAHFPDAKKPNRSAANISPALPPFFFFSFSFLSSIAFLLNLSP